MKPVSPEIPNGKTPEVIVAEHQDEYQNLPAIRLEGVYLENTHQEMSKVADMTKD